ncbi:MAG TPA: phosphotransferase [Ktedonobacteraceae bacterium]|nr:phosphotransferase [Ktedonobacteraceae bacterium]
MSDSYFPTTHSTLSSEALLSYVQERYDIGDIIQCKFLNQGLNDTYLLQTIEDRYILRVYRAGWRTLSDILYELDMLLHLHRKDVPVSYPLTLRDGNIISTLNALEGTRQAILFTYAPGTPEPRPRDEAYSAAYGQAVAEVHNALEDFSSPHARFHLDLDHLLDAPLQIVLPSLTERPDDQTYLLRLTDTLKERLNDLPLSALERGACHGDFHGGNAHITEDRQVTFFDFDCCGPGWRAYDIAVFRWSIELSKGGETLWESYLEGYTRNRAIHELDMEAIPLFVAIRHIWLLGLHVHLGADFGSGWLNKQYFDRNMSFLKKWVDEHIIDHKE